MIIIEGADLTGKTTLQKLLVAELRRIKLTYASCHLGRMCDEDNQCEQYLDFISTRQVWDRFHMSEVVYRAEDQRPTLVNPNSYREVDEWLEHEGCMTIIMTASTSELNRRFALRGDQYYDLAQIHVLNSNYERIVRDQGLECRNVWFDINYDVCFHATNMAQQHSPKPAQVTEWVQRYLERLSKVRPRLGCLETRKLKTVRRTDDRE